MKREELKAEALIDLGSEPAPKEWENIPCIKEQMPSLLGGEVSLQRFMGTDICAWFVGIGGLWQPQSDYFQVSLPPAEGAENKLRDVLQEVQRLIEINDGATGGELRAIWNSLSFAITESERRPQPTAEGAEEIFRKCFAEEAIKRGDTPLSDEKWNDLVKESGGFMFRAMEQFATLHAQQMAEKMVEERLKNAPKNCPKAAQCAHVEGGMKCPPNVICPI